MQFQPYLTFNGNCAEAMKTYERVFGGKLDKIVTFGDMPPEMAAGMAEACPGTPAGPMPDAVKKLVLHASLSLEGSTLMASDAMPGMTYGIKGVGVTVSFPSVDRARQVFEQLSAGGKVEMPAGETFWVEWFASVVDRFGTSWLINGGKMKM